jgi:hypothetical protein
MSLPEHLKAEVTTTEEQSDGGKPGIVVLLPASAVLRDDARIDAIIGAIFDQLDQVIVELRIREELVEF